MDELDQFLELLELDNHLISKKDVQERVSERGFAVTERQLTTFITERLLPKSIRVDRSGQLPVLAVDLVCFILGARKCSLSFGAIRELVPVWLFMQRCVLEEKCLDLNKLERVVGDNVGSPEAAFAVPWVVQSVLPMQEDHPAWPEIRIVYQGDLSERLLSEVSADSGPVISFVLAPRNNEGQTAPHLGVVLSHGVRDDDPTRVLVNVPSWRDHEPREDAAPLEPSAKAVGIRR